MREIEGKTGHFGEAPPPPEWMPMLSLIAWVGRTARAAIAGRKTGEYPVLLYPLVGGPQVRMFRWTAA
jgi:hypothetical protein